MLIKKIFESYLIDKIKDIFINTIDSKGKTIKDQFAYCIDKSLTYLGEKYNFEYRSKYFGYLFVPLLPIKMVHYSHGRETIE